MVIGFRFLASSFLDAMGLSIVLRVLSRPLLESGFKQRQ